MIRGDRERVDDAKVRVLALLDLAEAISMHSILERRDFRQSALYDLIVTGEALGRVAKDVQGLAPDIPWRDITDTRNRIVHNYWQVDLDLLNELIIRDLPVLAEALQRLELLLDRDT